MTNNDDLGTYPAPGVVRLVRLLPGPIERVWEYLTDSNKRAKWFAEGATDQRVGGTVVVRFRHANLGKPGEAAPDWFKEFEDKCDFTGKVTRCEPPRVLSFTWGRPAGSEVTFELTPQGGKVLFVLTHRRLGSNRESLAGTGTGWHTHVAVLVAQLEGSELPGFWSTFERLNPVYEKLVAG
jgi:uncharacterized protein YndB with AHSA1/START domain